MKLMTSPESRDGFGLPALRSSLTDPSLDIEGPASGEDLRWRRTIAGAKL